MILFQWNTTMDFIFGIRFQNAHCTRLKKKTDFNKMCAHSGECANKKIKYYSEMDLRLDSPFDVCKIATQTTNHLRIVIIRFDV